MNLRIIVFSFLAVFLFSSFDFHPLNMSVADVSSGNKKLHWKFKFFTDNISNTLTKNCGKFIDLETDGYDAATAKCLQKYLSTRFEMSVNNTPCKFVYKNASLNKDVLTVEYEAALPTAKIKAVKIKNIVLFDNNFPEMKNIINIHLLNQIKVLEFDYDESYRTGMYTQEIRY
ncbi:MAG: hypothetical protein H7Y13_06410 [Sphingobacteriaceae bacterium]|nr:hypothetical protein [Sphingobacteriaceae bacterium]